jgi:hypothetical protein
MQTSGTVTELGSIESTTQRCEGCLSGRLKNEVLAEIPTRDEGCGLGGVSTMVSTQGAGPRIPVPAVLRSDVPGTWAHNTMSHRIRTDILDRVFRENAFSPGVLAALRSLDAELEAAGETVLTPIPDDGGPDVARWNSVILPDALRNRETWLSAPWAVAEFYFYRRLMACIGYFKEPLDPFAKQKLLGLTSSIASMETLAARVNAALVPPVQVSYEDFECFVLTSLWGNRSTLASAQNTPSCRDGREHTASPIILPLG